MKVERLRSSDRGWAVILMLIYPFPLFSQETNTLRERERLVQRVCQQAMPTVVSITGTLGSSTGGATGVVVASDGTILTEFHVSHARFEGDKQGHTVGTAVPVRFADGQETTATLLGGIVDNSSVDSDLALAKLSGERPFAFSAIEQTGSVKLGDWVLKFGHPAGWRAGRKPVVRLGRVIRKIDSEFITDCHVVGGDSGGPYFDLRGKVVGLLRTSSVPGVSLPESMAARTNSTWAATSSKRLNEAIPVLLRSEINRDLVNRWPAQLYADEERLDLADWKHGERSLAEWTNVIAPARHWLVRVMDGETQVALGTVVDAGGRFVTRASAMPALPRCISSSGLELQDVRLIGVSPEFDLALYASSSKLSTPLWRQSEPLQLGSFLAAPGHGPSPLAVGIVSVEERMPKGKFRTKVVRDQRIPAEPPEWIGIPVAEHGMVVVAVEGNAAKAGIEPADELIQMGATSIQEPSHVIEAIKQRFARDTIPVTVIRKSHRVTFPLELDNRSVPAPKGQQNDSFRIVPVMYEHDAPVAWQECGGPLVDLDGRITGVTIARLGDYGCIAIPAFEVQRIAHLLLSQQPQ